MWQKKSGQRIDGALTLDPTRAELLPARHRARNVPGGEQVGADNVVKLVESDVYARFPHGRRQCRASNAANAARKAFLIGVAEAMDNKLLSGGSTRGLLDAAAHASAERRLLVWSANPAIEKELMQTSLAGTLDAQGHPYSGFTVTNAAGSKLDYYLDRSHDLPPLRCGSTRDVTATITLTNDAPRSGCRST